jgi:predicted  nucleic acid-binding Zn-ribbon protein
MVRLQQQIDDLNKERRRVDGELGDQQELLKKYQGQLMQVKNQQQYAAAWKEIDIARKSVKDLEDSLLKKMGELEEAQKGLDERLENHTDLQQRYDHAYGEWQESLGDLKAEIAKLRDHVENAETQIPEKIRKDFYRILKQRQGVAVSAVVNEACSACRYKIRSQAMQQIRRGEFIHCEGCGRILYFERTSS